MGDSKLCLLLLLSTSALAFAQHGDQPTCLLAKRYKTLHKYEYLYQAESTNEINGASPLKNGPKASCRVELEVSQTCSFTLRTSGCSLSEVVDTDAEGNPVFAPAATADAFAAEMEKYPLKFVVEGVYDVKLYPEDGETTTILNFKRGIVSALAVPLLEEDQNKNMPTIHGKCKTQYQVNAREDIATDVTLNRYLSKCENFAPIRDSSSPLALISGMHYPLAKLFSSFQTCNYKFDNEKKHMTSGSCAEKHILIPFSHKGEHGVTSVGKQELTLVQVSPHDNRVFEPGHVVKSLHMEAVEDKSAVQDKDAFLKVLRDLATLSEAEGERRAHLFHRLATMVSGMKADTLSPAIPEALAVSQALTYQILAQCGTPECSSAIMQILRTFDKSSLKIDATVFTLGIMSNPSALLISNMLEMAKYKPSKPIMYALSYAVKRFYKAEGKLSPEIHSVAEFMAARLGDCSGSDTDNFMTLRVVGNMAPYVLPASPALRSAVIQCVNEPAASLAVQQAAIQVYRLIPVPQEDREILMQVLLNHGDSMQKRIAAYLILMKDPQPSELVQLSDALSTEPDVQFKSFVVSHINNILTSTEPKTQELRHRIRDALQGNEIGPVMDRTRFFSNNYKIGSVEGNMLFDGESFLPKEVMLDMTLRAFGYDIDMMEIGLAGRGFEPAVEALFATALKTKDLVFENLPVSVSDLLLNMLPALKKDRMKRQDLRKEIKQKFVRQIKESESPEAMVYLRLLGNELGYLSPSDMEWMTMAENMFKMFPSDLMAALVTKNDNSVFGHYVFMDNKFFLPTVTGVPLKIALSGTFTAGIKGGLTFARDLSEVTFMPSACVEFVTHIGSHFPEYVNSGLEMHTNIFHESGLSAKLSVNHNQVKLSIPAPTSPTKLIQITNSLVAVTSTEVKPVPPAASDKVDVSECTLGFAGMKYCSALQYTDASSQESSPYFPFTGDSKFAVELHPTGEVTEYTATAAYQLLHEGEDGRQKVDSVKFSLTAQGAEPTEARAILRYNRRKNLMTADVQIPDYDVEAGLRLGVGGKSKGKGTHSVFLEFVNKDVPQLSLVGRADFEAVKGRMLQGQVIIPPLNADATVTANIKFDQELELELESEIKLMDATSGQKIALKYSNEKIEAEFKSDVNMKTSNLPGAEVFAEYGDDLLDTQLGQTDMTVRHIFRKLTENFRTPDIPEISLPETLFLTTEAKAAYHFSDKSFSIYIPVPVEEPVPASDTPGIYSLLTAVKRFSVSIPLFNKAELSALLRSNLYNMEASVSVEEDASNYSAKLNVNGISPLDVLSVKIDGLGAVVLSDSVMASLKTSLVHKFIKASVSIEEEASITDKLKLRSSSKIEAMSTFGFAFAIENNGLTGINAEEISADNTFSGMFKVGPMFAKTTSAQAFAIFPFRTEAKIDSSVEFDSSIAKAQNAISATFANDEFSFASNTKAFEDSLTHVVEFSFKDHKVSLKGNADVLALGVKIRRRAEASADASGATMKMETGVELSDNIGYSLVTGSLDGNGLAVNNSVVLKLLDNTLTHKASVKFNKDGLTTSGTTSLQSPLSLENSFDAGLDFSKAILSITNKAALSDISINNANTLTVTLSAVDFKSKAHTTGSEYGSYTHDISLGLKPFSASANINNNLNLLSANLKNEAKLEAEFFKIDVIGSLKATYGQEEIKHTYELKYADMTANAKFNSMGKVLGAHMNHNTELDVFGLAITVTDEARFNSHPVRFDHSIRCSIVPFDINLDALFSADGDIVMHGKHKAQLYGKYSLKAQSLAFVSVHECRASITNALDNGLSLETTFDTNAGIVLSPQEQQTRFKMTSKMNEHAFNQGLSLYNTAERTGVEVTGTIFTNIFNAHSTGNQEFTVSAFAKYDKSTDSHVIQLPLIDSVSVLWESIKGCVVLTANALLDYITSYNLNEAFNDLQATVNLISDLQMNILFQLKDFAAFMQKPASLKAVEAYFRDLEKEMENFTFGIVFALGHLIGAIHKTISSSAFVQELYDLDEEYQIRQVIVQHVEMVTPCIDTILIPQEMLEDPVKYIFAVVKDLDIPNRVIEFQVPIKELILKLEADKIIQPFLEKLVELLQQLKIKETIQDVIQTVEEAEIISILLQAFNRSIIYLKSLDVKYLITELNRIIKTVEIINLLDYNEFVRLTNNVIDFFKDNLNELIKRLEIPQKLEATIDFVNFLFSSTRGFTEHLREVKIAEIIKSVQDIIDGGVVNTVKVGATFIKQKITNVNFSVVLSEYLNTISRCCVRVIFIITEKSKLITNVLPDPKIASAIEQVIDEGELTVPSVPIPFTNLVLPPIVVRMDDLKIPTQVNIPQFTLLGNVVNPITISLDDIRQKITELLDVIINLEIKYLDADALFGDLTLNFFPSIPEISFPEVTSRISFPTIPTVPVEKLVKSLAVPELKLPTIPTEITVPSFGKLHGEIKLLTPIYTIKTSGELQKITIKNTPQVTGFLNSHATSEYFENLNYEFNSTVRIAIPKMSRVVLAETVRFSHAALGFEHQASVSFYGPSAQAQAKTDVKVKTTPYTAKFANTAFFAIGGGTTASVNTVYNHLVYLPFIGINSGVTVTQKTVAQQNGPSLTLTVDNSCEGKINADNSNHKSNLLLSATLSDARLTFSSDTDALGLKMKQQITAESGTLSYFKFNVHSEADSPLFKNSLLEASGHGNFNDMKLELKANHDTELQGGAKGVLSSALNLVARPFEFVYEFQNKGSAVLGAPRTQRATIDLQNDYAIILTPDRQQIATVALARLNQYKMFYNVSYRNNEREAGVFAAMESTGVLYMLTFPNSIFDIDLQELKSYELPALENIFTTTEQTLAVDAKLVYQKGQPFAEIMGLIQIPSMANMITELSVKSAFLNLNANAGLYPEDNLVFRLGATTASVFESLNSKLQGTTTLTTKKGIKLANSLSFENPHLEGSHDSSISASSETFEATAFIATTAKISLPIVTLETKQHLVANTKNKPNVISTLTMKGDFNLPVIQAVGKAEADHSMKLEGTLEYVSLESTTRANMDGTIDTHYLVLGVLDNEVNVYLNNDGLRSTSKVTADVKVNHGTSRFFSLDAKENLAIEASLNHVYAVLTYTNNNEAKLLGFHTKGKHNAKATVDVAPTSALTANIEIEILQLSNMGDVRFSEKTVVEVTVPKQKVSTTATFSSPLFNSSMEADLQAQVPLFKVTFKSSGASDKQLIEYDIKASTSTNYENDALSLISQAALTSADVTLDVSHVITKALRMKHQADDSVSRHTLRVHVSSPHVTFADLSYAAGKDGISASASTPFTGLLGFQLHGPSQPSARVYYHSPSAHDADVDILVIKTSPVDADKMNLQLVYNLEAHNALLSELEAKLTDIIFTFKMLAEFFLMELAKDAAEVLDMIVDAVFAEDEAYYDSFVENIMHIEIPMPGGDVLTVEQIWEPVSSAFTTTHQELVDFVNSIEGLDTSILEAAVENVLSTAESVISDYLDAVISNISGLYEDLAPDIEMIIDQIVDQCYELLISVDAYIGLVLNYLSDQYIATCNQLSDFLSEVLGDAKPYVDVGDKKLEINLTFPFQQ